MNKLSIYISILGLIISSIALGLFFSKTESKTAYFISNTVYNEFQYKIELEQEIIKLQENNKQVLDSLELEFNAFVGQIETAEPTDDQKILLQRKQQNYMEHKEKFEEAYTKKAQDSYSLIWDRINSYVQDLGKAEGYDFIFGATGDGALMYAAEGKDITETIVDYINETYNGKN